MRIALCNEVVRDLPFERQCALAASLGYDGLEVAPFTLGADPHLLPASRRAALRRVAAESGVVLTGLHWLLMSPAGLSITDLDAAPRTRDVIERLLGLCADLGGTYVVHGSPAQRRLPPQGAAEARRLATDTLAHAARAAAQAGIVYCLEPLAPPEANFVTSIAEAAEVVQAVGSPALRTMIDTCAAGLGEAETPEALIARWMPASLLAHVHLNDPNKRGPGQGAMRFGPILSALREQGYAGWIGVEPFDYTPDGETCAARAIGYLRGLLERAR
ncbi:MAG: sugar phosphate isomerase/epimerase family protein [Acetobacteraceae bacterium]